MKTLERIRQVSAGKHSPRARRPGKLEEHIKTIPARGASSGRIMLHHKGRRELHQPVGYPAGAARKPLDRAVCQSYSPPKGGRIALSANERIAEFLDFAIQAKFAYVNKLSQEPCAPFSRFASILRDSALSSSLIDSRRGGAQQFSAVAVLEAVAASNFLIAVLVADLTIFVAEGLVLNNADALDSRLNVRQRNSPPRVYSIISRSFIARHFRKKQGNFTIFFCDDAMRLSAAE